MQNTQARLQACAAGQLNQSVCQPHVCFRIKQRIFVLELQALIHRDTSRELPDDFSSVLSVFLGGPHRHFFIPSLLQSRSVTQTIKDAFRFPVSKQKGVTCLEDSQRMPLFECCKLLLF